MAAETQYSVDPKVQDVFLTVLFLGDGSILNVENFESHGRVYVGGDLINLEREEGNKELAVILGVGDTESEAEHEARVYVRRLLKWHGQGDGDGELIFCGYNFGTESAFYE
ncbi:uncharacterized protein LOC117639198 [Thrips palmi]|uniref:Uncharacterized protein LOC117639198 n=1 Tax=Thrips palmi TaxID=161013 RepID=A0A6P8Y2I9_THRPL|nr:uncharacterized protein LOC117639198 [Thrips palmi]